MNNLHRESNFDEDEIVILKEEFLSTVNDNNNSLSTTNEYNETNSLATINSNSTPYTESITSEVSSVRTLSSSALEKRYKFTPSSEISCETTTTLASGTSTDPEISSEISRDPADIQFEVEKEPSNDNVEKSSNSWKAVSEYEEFWNAWENGHDLEKMDTAMNKIQEVFEKVHLPEPRLPTVPKSTKVDSAAKNSDRTRAKPDKRNVSIRYGDHDYDQFQHESFDGELSTDSTLQEFYEDDDPSINDLDNDIDFIDDASDISDVLAIILREK